MRSIATLAVVLACTACQPQPDSMLVATAPGEAQLAQHEPQLNCRDLNAPITVGARPEQPNTRACQQPDGRWHVVQNTPGLPTQAYGVPPPAEAAAERPTSRNRRPTSHPAPATSSR